MGRERCNTTLRAQGKPYPRTCNECALGPCPWQHVPLPNAVKPYLYTTFGWVIHDTKEPVKLNSILRNPVSKEPFFFVHKEQAEARIAELAWPGLVAIEARLSCEIPKNSLPS